MIRSLVVTLCVVLAIAAFAAGVFVARASREPPQMLLAGPEPPAGAAAAERGLPREAPGFALVDQDGHERALSDYRGQWVVVNFWATWCGPCLHEIPIFVDLQARHAGDVQFLGIAVDDAQAMAAFAREHGMNYPTMAAPEAGLALVKAYGNRTGGLPFTALVSPAGEIVETKAGAYTAAEAERLVARTRPDP